MTIIESLSLVPISFYLSVLFLPVVLLGYRAASKSRKTVLIGKAKPEDQLRDKKIILNREIATMLFLGASIAFGITLLISINTIVGDWRDGRNLFAAPLPAKTLPPGPGSGYPPAPPPVSAEVNAATTQ